MNSKDHSEDEFNSLRTYFSQEISKNSDDSNSKMKLEMNEMKSEMNEMKSEMKLEMNEMKLDIKLQMK